MCKLGILPRKEKKKLYFPKPYQQMAYPGRCITDPDPRLFQCAVMDVFSRLCFPASYSEQPAYSSAGF